MKDNTFRFLRGVLLMGFGAISIFAVQLALEIFLNDYPVRRLSSLTPGEARDLLTLLNGKLNQAMGVVFIAVGLAVPLTANMYSLKFLELFIRNPVNGAVLMFVVFANLSGLWASYSLKSTAVPAFQLNLLFVLTIASLLLILPYLIYVFRFLHPNTLLALLERDVNGCFRGACDSDRALENRRRAAETLEHIANVSVRSVDRSDRNTAIEGVLALERAARTYGASRGKLPACWFSADPGCFLGFSSLAVEEMSASRSWVEMKLYYQFYEILRAACPKMPELTSAVAQSLRKLGVEDASANPPAQRELVIEYFNSFLRLALNRRDIRSLFIIFDQYRMLAEALHGTFPEQCLEIAYYFEYYGQVAREQQMPFVVETVAHDLGALVQDAWERKVPTCGKLLERFLRFDRQNAPPLAGVKKAQALLAGYFIESGQTEAAALVRESFRGLEPAFIESLREDLLRVTRQKYWEVSDRRMNMDYVPAERRERMREFFDGLLEKQGPEASPPAGPGSAGNKRSSVAAY
jgi:hypothetical protein